MWRAWWQREQIGKAAIGSSYLSECQGHGLSATTPHIEHRHDGLSAPDAKAAAIFGPLARRWDGE